jgi:hypothetical protein
MRQFIFSGGVMGVGWKDENTMNDELFQKLRAASLGGIKAIKDWADNEGIGEAEEDELVKLAELIGALVTMQLIQPDPELMAEGTSRVLKAAFQIGRAQNAKVD